MVAPTDTVYGMLADATNDAAVRNIITIKNRPPGKPISVFVENINMLKHYVSVDRKQVAIVKKLLPGPYTIILPSRGRTSRLLESEEKTLGVRIPDYSFISELVRRFKKPLTATSANSAGSNPHYRIDTLLHDFTEKKRVLIDGIIDAGKLPHRRPSTVVDLTTSTVRVLRYGDVSLTHEETYESHAPSRTMEIGSMIVEKYRAKSGGRPLVFIMEGDLGSGKTVLTKGIAGYLGIHSIISPTYVVYYEYEIHKPGFSMLYHFDLYNIHSTVEFVDFRIDKLVRPGSVFCIEWGEKAAEIMRYFRQKAMIIRISIRYTGNTKRKITVGEVEEP